MKVTITITTPDDDDRHGVRIHLALADTLKQMLGGYVAAEFDSWYGPSDFGRVSASNTHVKVDYA